MRPLAPVRLWREKLGVYFFAMRRLIICIIFIAFVVNSAGQGYALRSESTALSFQTDISDSLKGPDKPGLNQDKTSSCISSEDVPYSRLGESNWYNELNAYLAGMTGVHPGEQIIEIGAGTGASTAVLLDKMEHRGKIIALEPNPEYLDIAVRVFKDEPVKFILANAQETNSMMRGRLPADKAFLFNAMHLIDGHETLLDDISEIIKPDGTLAFNTAYFKENNSEFKKVQRRIFVKLLRNAKVVGKNIMTNNRTRFKVRSIEHYEEALKKAGFEIVGLKRRAVKIPFLDIKDFYSDKSVTDYIAPSLTLEEREEFIMRLVMDEINLARDKGRDHIEGEWLYIVAKNLNGKNEPALFAESRMLSPKALFAEQRRISAISHSA